MGNGQWAIEISPFPPPLLPLLPLPPSLFFILIRINYVTIFNATEFRRYDP